MNLLKQSTAATIKLGPFVDDTDGKTAETALTIGQADIRLSKNGGDIAQTHNATGATHDELGYYDIPLDTTDTGTLGRLRVLVSKAGALPVWQDFLIVTANVFDTFCSAGSLNVNAVSLSTDAITAASVKADAVTKIQNGLATSAALDAVDNFIDTEVAAILAAVDTEVAAIKAKTDNLPASPAAVGSAMTLTAAYDKAKDDVLTPLAVVDSIVDGLKTTLDNIHDTDLPAVKTDTAAIKAKTDNLPATPASAGEYTAAIAAIPTAPLLAANYTAPDNASIATIKAKTNLIPANPAVADEYDAALAAIQADLDNPNQYKADVSGLATTAHVQEVENKIDAIDVTVNTIPTNPLLDTAYTAPDNAGIAAIQEKTEQLTFTAPNKVDANATIDPTGIATSAELEAVDDKVDEILSKLNSDPLPKIGVGITGSTINAIRGDDFIEALTGVDVLEGSKCQFAIKTRRSDGDNQSLLLVDSETGMIKAKNMLNATSDMAAVTIVGGVYQLEIKAILSRSIPSGSLVWGAQIISAEGQVLEKWGGVWNQIEDTIKAVS